MVTVTAQQIKRLVRPQKRVVLNLLGMAYTAHPTTLVKLNEELTRRRDEDPARFKQAYDTVMGTATMPETKLSDEAKEKQHLVEFTDKLTERMRMAVSDVFRPNFDAISNAQNKVDKYADSIKGGLEKAAAAAITQYAKKFVRYEVKVGNQRIKKMDGVLPKQFEQIVSLAAIRQNIMMVGPSGSGKTYLAEQLSKALDMTFASISCSVGMSESQLLGYMLPTGAGGKFEYHASEFVNAYEKGGVFLLDEMDAADENTLIIINKALANESFHVPQRVKNPTVKKHKNFVCVAAMNTLGTGEDMVYTGRNALDGATLDRFRAGFVFIDYDDTVEERLVHADVLKWGRAIRSVIRRDKLERIMSTRVMLDFSRQAEVHGWGEDRWNESYFADWSASEKARVGHVIRGEYK